MFAIANRNFLKVAAMAFLTLSALPAGAATLVDGNFSTQTPPYETDTGNAWSVGGPGLTEIAVGFQDPSATTSYLLNQIQVADNFSISDPNASGNASLNDLTVGLWQAATNDPNAATLLQSWTIAPPGAPGAPGTAFTLNSATPTSIGPGLFYFITETTANDGANTAEWGWQENNLTPMQIGYFSGTNGTPGSYDFQNNGCTVDPCTATNDPNASGTPAFVVTGDAIVNTPEPATWGLLAAAGAFAALVGRKRLIRGTSGC
jgi:hypothetical protein